MVKRVVFNEVTRNAVIEAFRRPREIDHELVDAYLARRALDYLVGFTLSPVLWRKLPGSRSAGRVQSVALRLVCEREAEIEAFKSREYWTIEVEFKTEAGNVFTARLTHLDGRRLDRFDLDTEAKARAAAEAILRAPGFAVAEIDSREVRRNPFPPFTTSTLQQEASRKLGLGASRTMQIAQRLYEGIDLDGETVGLITYMRTDGVAIASEAIAAVRELIGADFGPRYVPDRPRVYRSPAKNAQEAHEAIRPTDLGRKPADVARLSRPRPAPALRADLETHRRQPDGLGAAGAGHRRHRRSRQPSAVARDRVGRRLRRISGALPGRPRRHRGRRGRGRQAAGDEEGRAAGAWRSRTEAAFHPAATALHRSEPGQKARRARHRPSFDLRLDPAGFAGPRLCQARKTAFRAGGPRPARHCVSDELFRALCRVQFHRRPRKPARRRVRRAHRLEGIAAPISGRIFRPRSTAPGI